MIVRARQERCDEICDDFVRRFDEKRVTKTRSAGTHREDHCLLKITTKLSTNSLVTQKCFAARRLSAVLLLTFANAITKNQQNSQMAVKLTLKM